MSLVQILPTTTTKEQALTDIVESIALQQAALSSIIKIEAEKIKIIISMPTATPCQIVAVNKSVQSMILSISKLEMILQSNLDMISTKISSTQTCS